MLTIGSYAAERRETGSDPEGSSPKRLVPGAVGPPGPSWRLLSTADANFEGGVHDHLSDVRLRVHPLGVSKDKDCQASTVVSTLKASISAYRSLAASSPRTLPTGTPFTMSWYQPPPV
jgi:hypothetical protein